MKALLTLLALGLALAPLAGAADVPEPLARDVAFAGSVADPAILLPEDITVPESPNQDLPDEDIAPDTAPAPGNDPAPLLLPPLISVDNFGSGDDEQPAPAPSGSALGAGHL